MADRSPAAEPRADSASSTSPARPTLAAADPLVGDLWHLAAINANYSGAPTGRGVTVVVIDDGVEYTHPDLSANYDRTTDWDTETETGNGAPRYGGAFGDLHGTAVAGLIAAVADNGIGVRGVAYGATLSSVRIDFTGRDTDGDDDISEALIRGRNFDVANASWGYDSPFVADFEDPAFQASRDAIGDGADLGRGSLGTIWVFAGGNYRAQDGDSNESNFTNDRRIISVAATEQSGNVASFSSPGWSLLLAGPAANVSTDRVGAANGYNDTQGENDYANTSYTEAFGGTSAATPIVSSVVARMLELEPGLGWRDVQSILAASAKRATGTTYVQNDADTWNGGGMYYSKDAGFGLVDARAAERMADTWLATGIAAQKSSNETSRSFDEDFGAGQTISNAAPISVSFSVPNVAGFRIEHVELKLDFSHSFPGDLVVTLTSPSGDVARLIDRPGGGDESFDLDTVYSLATRAARGETGTGTWTLNISDAQPGDNGVLRGATLILHGASGGDDRWIYTDRFGSLGSSAGRQTVTDTTGTDVIDGSALTGNATLDLRQGSTSTVAGKTFTIAAGSIIESAVGGDGSDQIFGNDSVNQLYGGRGNDRIEAFGGGDLLDGGLGNDNLRGMLGNDNLRGGNGDDVLIGGDGDDVLGGAAGNDSLSGGAGDDTLRGSAGTDTAQFRGASAGYDVTVEGSGVRVIDTNVANGDDGSDFLVGIERLRFTDRLFNTADAIALL